VIGGGAPIGLAMLAWLYAGAPAVSIEWRLLHASLQLFGFFGALIVGVAHHLFARFTGRATAPSAVTRPLFALLLAALLLRVAGTWGGAPAAVLAAAALQSLAFLVFAAWVWRCLDPPPLAQLRRHLVLSSGWIAAACLCETFLRARAIDAGFLVPPLAPMRAVHAMALLGGVTGWVSGILLRAGPMFVPRWNVPASVARVVPWLVGLGAALAAAGEWAGDSRAAMLGELIVVGSIAAMLVAGGVLRQAGGMLPMVARSAEESRIFRLAVSSLAAAVLGAGGWGRDGLGRRRATPPRRCREAPRRGGIPHGGGDCHDLSPHPGPRGPGAALAAAASRRTLGSRAGRRAENRRDPARPRLGMGRSGRGALGPLRLGRAWLRRR